MYAATNAIASGHTVLLVLCRRVIAELLIDLIQGSTQIETVGVYDFSRARNMAQVRQPTLALVEIPERNGEPAQEALDVCEDIKETSPGCKIMLMCPEQDGESVRRCADAKRKGEIEDYIFYDASPEYLVSKLESLLPA